VEGSAEDLFPGIVKNRDEILREKAELESKLKQFKDIDPEKARKILADQHKLEEEKARQSGEWENWKAQLTQTHEAEKAKLTEQMQRLEADLNKELITSKAMTALTGKGVLGPIQAEALLGRLGAKVVAEGEARVVRVFDGAGQVRYNKKGEPMSLEERVDEMHADRENFGWAFKAGDAGGSGTPPGNTGSPGGGKFVRKGDQEALNMNIEAIAKGDVTVID
jgi:hypothetical protein